VPLVLVQMAVVLVVVTDCGDSGRGSSCTRGGDERGCGEGGLVNDNGTMAREAMRMRRIR
jgi:hypothetical protein